MATEDKYTAVYVGSEVNVQHLQNLFGDEDIESIVKNDSESAIRAGFGPAIPGQARLLVHQNDERQASKIVAETFPAEEEGEE